MLVDSFGQIVEKVVHETSPKAIRLRVTVDQREFTTSGERPSLVLEQSYVETDRGERYFDERRIESGEQTSRVTSYCDGEKCANVTYAAGNTNRQNRISIGRDFMFESRNGYRDAPSPGAFTTLA